MLATGCPIQYFNGATYYRSAQQALAAADAVYYGLTLWQAALLAIKQKKKRDMTERDRVVHS